MTGIIASPSQASLSISPAIHNAAFEDEGMDWVYAAFPVEPEELPEALWRLAAAGVVGLNVTMPHKVAVCRLIDELSEEASAIGAVNTITIRDHVLKGFDTDGEGLIRSLNAAGEEIAGRRAIVLGTGGAARAAVFSLAGAGASRITVIGRDRAKIKELESLAAGVPFGGVMLEDMTDDLTADIILNATPLGQLGERTPFSEASIRSASVVCDMVYRPRATDLIALAESAGVKALNGVGMLVHQAALSFEIWTGRTPSIEVMTNAAERELALKQPSSAAE